ncbi:MAG: DUF499 domain-containing protein [Chitinophagaceae bacterium]
MTNVAEFLDPALVPNRPVRVAAFDGENADPANGRPMGEGVRAHTPWGEIAYQLAGKAGYEIVRRSDEQRIAPGADTIKELFGSDPVLVVLDELGEYLRRVQGMGGRDQLTAFLKALLTAIESTPHAAIVYTLAVRSDGKGVDAFADENEFLASAMSELESVSGRKATVFLHQRSWTGRYFALFVISLLHPIKFGLPDGIKVFAFIWICLFVVASWFFTRSYTDKKASIFVTALLVSVYCWQMPSTAEAFFWIPSTMSYQLGIGLQLVFFRLLDTSNKTKLHKFLLCLLALSIPGTSEVNLLVFICILSVIVFYTLLKPTVNNTKFIFQLFALAIVASIFSIISPGNSVRTEVLTENAKNLPIGDLFYAIKGGLIATKEELFMLFARTPLLLFSLLLVLLKPWHKIFRSR